jgi:hypothetical protein
MAEMNPLLFANLSTQRRLLESGTAYAAARLAVNIVFVLAGIAGVIVGYLYIRVHAWSSLNGGGFLPGDFVFGVWALGIVSELAWLAGLYVAWVAARAFFDMADACLAISLHGPEQQVLPADSGRGPRQGGGSWPEPPKPLVPGPEAVQPGDAKYLPKA